MRIPIPEVEFMFGKNATTFDVFKYLQSFIEILTRDFHTKYNFSVISKIDDVEAGYICRIISSFHALYYCANSRDYSSASVLCRAIVDRIAILKFIFSNTEETERSYRYYLYVLDGIKEREKLLSDKVEYDGNMDRFIFDSIEQQVKTAQEKTKTVIEYCLNNLNSHPYATKNPVFHNAVLKNAIWQYSEFGKTDRNNSPIRLKWQQLYQNIENRNYIISVYSNYLSQFVHGLSISILQNINNDENLESLMSIAICLQYEVIKEIFSRYKPNYADLTSDDISYLISNFSEEYIQSLVNKYPKYEQVDKNRQ